MVAKKEDPQSRNGRAESDGEEKPSKPFTYDPDNTVNLVPDFVAHPDGLRALKEIAERVKDNFTAAQDASESEITRMKDDIAVLLGELPEKDAAFENAARAHMPIMLKTVSRLESRLSGELFANFKDFCIAVPTSVGLDPEIADIVTKHTNWQLSNKIPDFPRQCKRGIMFFLVYGDVTCHSTYDPVGKRNRHEMLTPEEFVAPAVKSTTMPDYSDLPYYARVMDLYRADLERKKDDWYGVEELLAGDPPAWDDAPEQQLSREAMTVAGVDPTEQEDATPYRVIWYEGWLDLPGQDHPRWCKVLFTLDGQKTTVKDKDGKTKSVEDKRKLTSILELSVHEQVNWQDQQRYDKELQELMAYRTAVMGYETQMEDLHGQLDAMNQALEMPVGPGMAALKDTILGPPQIGMQVQQIQQVMAGLQKPAPPPWTENQDGDPNSEDFTPVAPRKEPIHMFAHGVCIEPPAGPRGLSLGRQAADYNRAGDVLLSQFIDASSASNCPPGLVKPGIETPEKIKLSPGKLTPLVGFEGQDIRDAVYFLPIPPGNPALVELAQMMDSMAEEATQAPGILGGDAGKSGESARLHSMRQEAATKQLSSAAFSLSMFFRQIIQNNAALNARFLPEDEMVMVQDPEDMKKLDQLPVKRELYQQNYLFEFRTDMTFTSRAQRVNDADNMLQMIMTVPQLGGDIPLIRYAVGKCLSARGYKDYEQLLGPQPPPPQTPFGIQPPPPPGMGVPGQPGQAQPGGPPGQPSPPGQQPQQAPGMLPSGSPAPASKGQPSPPAHTAPAQPQ